MKGMVVALLVLLLGGCATVTKVGPGEVAVRDKVEARLDSAWNRMDTAGTARSELWTTDGVSLDILEFYVAIPEGEPLAQLNGRRERQLPRFRNGMAPQEIVELFEALVTEGGNSFRLEKLAPAAFAGGDGIRFEYVLVRKGDEVEMKGLGYAVVRNKQLYLLNYRAPRIYYFDRHLARVESVARSLRIKG